VRERITSLFKNLTIYGVGDVATNLVSFLLLPIYVRHLSPVDYGIIGLLLSVEVVAKIAFRFGLDGSFMRMYFDCADDRARQTLASTLFVFLLAVDGAALLTVAPFASPIATALFGVEGYGLVLLLTLLNIFVMGFSFLPFHVLRIQQKSQQFIAFTFARSAGTLLVRLLLVVGLSMGVLGVVLADIVVSVALTALLLGRYGALIRPWFSWTVLRDALAFGLPRLPHGIAHQIIAVADRYVLRFFVSLHDIGLYSIGSTFGLALKLFLSAFEYAWAPFYFSTMKEGHAKATFSLVTTYGVVVLAWMAAGVSAMAPGVVRLMTTPEFFGAAQVVPWVALGVLFQGVYLLTSIGLNITKNTKFYPMATGIAALTSVTANFVLVPRFGIVGAAEANALAYLALAGVSYAFSQRVYPMHYEWGRLMKVAAAAVASYGLARIMVAADGPALRGAAESGGIVFVAFPVALGLLGFFRARELAAARDMLTGKAGEKPPATL
jgi:O-antigen/teichoic acid export membrane protein